MTLYELSTEKQMLLQMAQDDDVDIQTIHDTMDAVEGEIADKAEGYVVIIKSLEADSKMIDEEIKRLQARKQSLDDNVSKMKTALTESMKVADMPKFKSDHFSFWIQKSTPSVVIDSEADIPTGYWKPQKPKLDKKQLAADLKKLPEGERVTYAHLEQAEGVRFR